MESNQNLNKEIIRLKLEILNCKGERLTYKKSFYESHISLDLQKLDLINNLIEQQRKLYIIEHKFLLELHKYSSSQTFIEETKKKIEVMEEDLKKEEEMKQSLLKKIEEAKELVKQNEEKLLAVQKEKDQF